MIVNDVEKIKKYVPINDVDDIVYFETALREAQEQFIARYLGDELTEILSDYVDAASPTPNAALDRLLNAVEPPICFYAYYVAIPSLDIAHTSAGFAVVQNNNQAPASKDRVANLRSSMLERAQNAVETLLKFLEKNYSDYPEWIDSEAYFEWSAFFVNTAKRFNQIININESRLRYLELRPAISEAESIFIEPAITPVLATEIRHQAAVTNTLSAPNALIYPLLQKASAYFAIAIDTDASKRPTAELYLTQAVNIILTNPENYPAAAALFPTERTTRTTPFENTAESGFYVSY